jgi:hypothetical protein
MYRNCTEVMINLTNCRRNNNSSTVYVRLELFVDRELIFGEHCVHILMIG